MRTTLVFLSVVVLTQLEGLDTLFGFQSNSIDLLYCLWGMPKAWGLWFGKIYTPPPPRLWRRCLEICLRDHPGAALSQNISAESDPRWLLLEASWSSWYWKTGTDQKVCNAEHVSTKDLSSFGSVMLCHPNKLLRWDQICFLPVF